jgi:hypothetical protein
MKNKRLRRASYTVELAYLAKDREFLFQLAQHLKQIPGLLVTGTSGGLMFDEGGKPIGREGAISVEATSSDLLTGAVDTFVLELRQTCGVSELKMVVRKDDGTICSPYLPGRLRSR